MRASLALLLAAPLLAVGCAQKNDALSTPQGQALLATDRIVKQSGGDWDKVSPADRQILISGPGGGTEQGAKDFLAMQSARSTFRPSPPPARGRPGGPAPAAGNGAQPG
jgi:hypothetical protein